MGANANQLQKACNAHQHGELQVAEQLYLAILRSDPDCAPARFGLGILASQLNHDAEAIELIRQAIRLLPTEPTYHQGMAGALAKVGMHYEAIRYFSEAVRLKPDFVEAWNDLGNSLLATGRNVEAENVYRRSLELKPDLVETYCNLGLLLHEKGALQDALACFEKGIHLNSGLPELHFNLGRLLEEIGLMDKAEASYRHAIENRPDFVQAWINLGGVLCQQRGRSEESRQAYLNAIKADPSQNDARIHLARLDLVEGRIEESHRSLNALHRDFPTNAAVASMLLHIEQSHCEWSRIQSLTELIVQWLTNNPISSTRSDISPINLLASPIMISSELLLRTVQGTLRRIKGVEPPTHRIRRSNTPFPRRIKVGYLSTDFRIHPVGYLIPELIESHDREQFEIIAYSTNNSTSDDIRSRLLQAFDKFRQVDNANDFEIAQQIADDEIDILVDLGGHSNGSRFELLSWRPAPIQATYLGFPGTTGAEYIDYIFVDEFVSPSSVQPYFTEKLVHLPGSYMVHDSRHENQPKSISREEVGLPRDAVVYCAFSYAYKISQPIFDTWIRILKIVPKSVLWLRIDDLIAQHNLIDYAVRSGIDSSRLIFAPLVTRAEHLARQRLADIALDTFPYNQHSTAAEALRHGLPMVTMIGQTMASRVAGSFVHLLGLPELATTSFQAYEHLAIELGNSQVSLQSIRHRLNAALQTTDLFSGSSFARKIEQAYVEMWNRYQRGEPPSMLTFQQNSSP